MKQQRVDYRLSIDALTDSGNLFVTATERNNESIMKDTRVTTATARTITIAQEW